MALEITNLRVLSTENAAARARPRGILLKIKGSEIQQAISELLMHAAGPYALPLRGEAMEAGWQDRPGKLADGGPPFAATATCAYLNQRKLSIFAAQ